MATAKKASPATRRTRRKLPDHILFEPIEGMPDWAFTLMGEDTTFIELPNVVSSMMVAQFTHDGSGPCEFKLLDEQAIDSIRTVSGTGKICERRSVNFIDKKGFKYILADVTGSWIIHFQSMADMEILETRAGSRVEGKGSDLVRFETKKPTRLDVSMPFPSGVEVWTLDDNRKKIISTNEPYSGVIIARAGLVGIEVLVKDSSKSEVQWSLTVGATTGAPDMEAGA